MVERVKRVAILGSTGSVGTQTLDIVRSFPQSLRVVALAAGRNERLLRDQVLEFKPSYVHAGSGRLDSVDGATQIANLEDLACLSDVDLVVVATVGAAGLRPTLAALGAGKPVALANKEVIVIAGDHVMAASRDSGAPILPVDSEPSAVWQCLAGESGAVGRLIITASGGAFRGRSWDSLANVSPEEALKHPTWTMGRKITIDSATLANKAFEVIEAHYLFDIPYDRIDVVIHRQSIIHSMVEFTDGSVKAQIGPPDMRYPIQFALFYPERQANPSLPRFDAANAGTLTFEPMDPEHYPCFQMIVDCGKRGGTWPAVAAGADEAAVDLFLDRAIRFTSIPEVIKTTLAAHRPIANPDLDDLIGAAEWARGHALALATGHAIR
ncbi:MAG: 1-deoxy-D-xylulose-5-phosphate reductoisomerase [SAR202 cluster bacterium]|nr:1-deoxy-D-xylulose-5-phosphate reductoisomerase [SAR202 cluster bacterium]